MFYAIEKTELERINEVKTTIIKMLVNRKFINEENMENKIKKLIEEDKSEYIIDLDNSQNYNSIIEDKKIYLKFINTNITSSSKGSEIHDYILKNMDKYKILIVENINLKSEKNITNFDTKYEIFRMTELQQNIIEHEDYIPHIPLNEDDTQQILREYNMQNKEMPMIQSHEIIVRYFNLRIGESFKILRYSQETGISPYYRLVVKQINS
jgi:DNA-directed RNA polymerase subunit H (RpoH/RPB5)